MKFFYTFILSVFILFAFGFSVMAQEQAKVPSPLKVAFVSPYIFVDKKEGIQIYLKALKDIENEFKPISDEFNAYVEKAAKLKKEIETAKASPVPDTKFITEKQDELDQLQCDKCVNKFTNAKKRYEKRVSETLKPIEDDIAKELKEFAKQKGITNILDLSAAHALMCCFGCEPDVTKEFIAYYNAKHAVTNSQTQVKLSELR